LTKVSAGSLFLKAKNNIIKIIKEIIMADISMELIKELKDKTGAGILDCKKTLQETDGNIDEAIDILRKKGMGKAAKKAGRTAKEGTIAVKVDGKKGLLAKVNCETDFVAKTDDFKSFANEVIELIYSKDYAPVDELPVDLDDVRKAAVGKLGENMLIPEWAFIKAEGTLYSYIHLGKVGAIVDFVSDKDILGDEDAQKMMKNVAMQIAAMSPLAVNKDNIAADVVAKEKEIYMEEARQSGKPEKILEKIAEGKLRKFYEENTLYEQEFILDGDKKVKDIVAELGKAKGAEVSVKSFIRVSL
jgi:elongation factor Ts